MIVRPLALLTRNTLPDAIGCSRVISSLNGALPRLKPKPGCANAPPAATLAIAARTPYASNAIPPTVAIGARMGAGTCSWNRSHKPSSTTATGQYDTIQAIDASGDNAV